MIETFSEDDTKIACQILIFFPGETSAGKSSVLNLLFEEEILPVHNNSSTSVITLVKYHRQKHARVVYKTEKPDLVFDLDDDGLEKLHGIAFMKSACEREHHDIKEVHVHLPLPILKVSESERNPAFVMYVVYIFT